MAVLLLRHARETSLLLGGLKGREAVKKTHHSDPSCFDALKTSLHGMVAFEGLPLRWLIPK